MTKQETDTQNEDARCFLRDFGIIYGASTVQKDTPEDVLNVQGVRASVNTLHQFQLLYGTAKESSHPQ
jgi:hypothetical protein